MNRQRLTKIQKDLQHPVLIKKKENLLYLTGRFFDYREEGYLLIKKNETIFFGGGLEKFEGVGKVDKFRNIGKYISPKQTVEIFGNFTFFESKYLRHVLKGRKLKITIEREPVDAIRTIKEAEEIALVKKSMQIVEKVFTLVRGEIKKPGMTEIKLAQFIESNGRNFGAEDVSFPAIVASGANAAIPHHIPSSKTLKAGESIIIDFGFKYKNYCSDFTRTVFLKRAQKKLADAYNQVEKAYNNSMEVAKVGAQAEHLYDISVETLKEKKLDKYFIHSLGHGTGLEIHELPNLSPKSKDTLQDGMVFSIEPGVYFPKLGGIRIEDLVYLENGECMKFINISTKLEDNIIK